MFSRHAGNFVATLFYPIWPTLVDVVYKMIKVLELFSGIGGMHFALKESGIDYEVTCALDINTTANTVYRHNFPNTRLMENNVECLDEVSIRKMNVNAITMSPPCQPFTRLGLYKDDKDNRTSALHHILNLIPKLTTIEYIFLENVVGFESSNMREQVINVLKESGFRYQEFIISPCQVGIPNSRTRYYLLAKRLPFNFKEFDGILREIPGGVVLKKSVIQDFLGENGQLVPDKILKKYNQILDVVTKDCDRSCCFTKGYTHYAEGTGSVFCPFSVERVENVYKNLENLDKNCDDYLNEVKSLEMRYFSPMEVAGLMAFPSYFSFPGNLTVKQKYRLLGNSVNVHVVSVLIKLLVL